MTRITEFYWVYEAQQPPPNRVYHNDNSCPSVRGIPPAERRPGTGGYRLCRDCR